MTRKAEERFAALHQRFGPALRRLALVYAGDPDGAADLLQEIWLGVWRALPGFRDECSERTFVYRIGHNRGITYRSRRPSAREVATDEVGELVDRGPAPDEAADRALRRDRLLEAVHRLRPGHRQVVMLSLEGLSAIEIAEVTGLSVGNVGVRLHRARNELRARLGREEVS